MLWLTWRQHRAQALVTAGLLAVLGVLLLINGLGARNLVDHAGLLPLQQHFKAMGDLVDWLALAPAAIGLFWGAPVLAKEFERGTHKLAWTQSVSLRRWLVIKLSVLGGAVTLAGLALGTMISLWLSSYAGTQYADRFASIGKFVISGILPAAWWLFAFATGVAAGAVFRKMLPAIALTLAMVVPTILGLFIVNARAYYATPEQAIVTVEGPMSIPEDWMIQDSYPVDAAGQPVPNFCPAEQPCPRRADSRILFLYQPPSRYWRFQWTEAAALFAATLALGAVAVTRTLRGRT
ncbi:ABC transporter permease [Actinophytocola sp.]|uniref:ABC transporter permease n=1 Tax=Actinophytocola sp. TaxID=1872138 RepID=UPI002D800880|nr:ABC transporter permease [Actinophytocola sp.]HET9140037.1 ABC transporter permease [Actinophytocola sp.]